MPRFRSTLLTLAPLAALALPAAASAQSCGAYVHSRPTDANAAQIREATLCLVNSERARHGLGALAHNATLQASAQWTAADMVARRYFGHTTPDGRGLQDKMQDYVAPANSWNIGENLAWGERAMSTPANTVVAWMNSPGHRANILNGDFREGGIGVVPGTPGGNPDGGTYANHFGTRSGVEAQPPSPGGDDVDDVVAVPKPKPKAKARKAKARCKRVTRRYYSASGRLLGKRSVRTCRRVVSRKR